MSEKQEIGFNLENFIKAVLVGLNIPTKSDINMLQNRIDELERLIAENRKGQGREKKNKQAEKKTKSAKKPGTQKAKKRGATSISIVLKEINKHPEGTDYKTIQKATGYEERKLRNIIFRLSKINKIRKIERGIYAKA
jgi:hypothetical protein